MRRVVENEEGGREWGGWSRMGRVVENEEGGREWGGWSTISMIKEGGRKKFKSVVKD
jgi:hypothetical protein